MMPDCLPIARPKFLQGQNWYPHIAANHIHRGRQRCDSSSLCSILNHFLCCGCGRKEASTAGATPFRCAFRVLVQALLLVWSCATLLWSLAINFKALRDPEDHPLQGWAMVHAGWLLNRYHITSSTGITAFKSSRTTISWTCLRIWRRSLCS